MNDDSETTQRRSESKVAVGVDRPVTGIAAMCVADGLPDRTFLDGSQYWTADLPGVRIGLGYFRPGWVWSRHAGAMTGKPSMAHVGYIQSGAMMVEAADGSRVKLGPGDAFAVGPGHDAWVTGDEVCIALDVTTN